LSWAFDPTFTTPGYPPGHVFFPNFGEASAAALQGDGKVVMGGWTAPNNQMNFSVVRLLNNGQPDRTFGRGGEVNVSFFNNAGPSIIFAVAVQPWDGKIVVAGLAPQTYIDNRPQFVFAIMRLLPDGTPDPTFTGTHNEGPGKVSVRFVDAGGQDMANAEAFALAIQDDHGIVVGGSADFSPQAGTGKRFALARLNEDGSLDARFGVGGRVLLTARDEDQINGLALLPPDQTGAQKILFAGQDVNPANGSSDFAVGQLLPDGSPDPAFARRSAFRGIRLIDFTPPGGPTHSDAASDLVRQPDGRIVVAGTTGYQSQFGDQFQDFAVARLTPAGNLDAGPGGFAGTGMITLDVGYVDVAQSVALQSMGADAGKIVIAGYSFRVGTPFFFSGARFNADGSLDATFNSNFPRSYGHGDQGWQVLVQPWDDQLVVAGFHTEPSVGGFAAVRLCADPTPCSPPAPGASVRVALPPDAAASSSRGTAAPVSIVAASAAAAIRAAPVAEPGADPSCANEPPHLAPAPFRQAPTGTTRRAGELLDAGPWVLIWDKLRP
jgi:uncharacterized delta-60 repeat protein